MAAGDTDKLQNRLSLGQKLPPVTLSKTSISGLMTLVPVLVAMTTKTSTPRFEAEEDKPPWWPEDVQWKNPKDCGYLGDHVLGKLLRKVIHSCYSYHGVEDLLCRLEDEDVDSPEVDIDLDGHTASPEYDGPVFVCCFCLKEFDSHKSVSTHQRVCQDKSHPIENDVDPEIKPLNFVVRHTVTDNSNLTPSTHSPLSSSHPEFSSQDTQPHPVSLSVVLHRLPGQDFSVEEVQESKVTSSSAAAASTRALPASRKDGAKSTAFSRRQQQSSTSTSSSGNKVVPTLKTRSQKKLDQIMERHSLKKLMIKECRELKEVPKTGAWWVNRKTQRKLKSQACVHPSEELTKQEFLNGMELLLKKVKCEQSEVSSSSVKKEVDLDCEIISVEGPLSMKLHPFVQHNAISPRSSKSLMSQMSRDESCRSARRRISSLCFVEDEWADREAMNEGRDPRQMSLLTLGLSSPLGQRIKKFVKVEGSMNVVKDVELSCSTEIRDESKLRIRMSDFKVTFRKKCRATSWVHKYKFNQYQIREFKRHMKTGLTRRSRYLMKKMNNCRVLLRRMTERDIELYNKEKKVTIAENIVVDDDLCITQIDIPEDGLKNYPHPRSVPSNLNLDSNLHHPGYHSSLSSSSSSHQSSPFRQHDASQPADHLPHRHHQQLSSRPPHTPHPYNHHRRPLPPSSSSLLSSSLINKVLTNSPRPYHLNPQSSNHSPSPPHIPNIFRNRSNSNTPSPPRPLHRHNRDSQSEFRKALSSLQGSSHPNSNAQQHHHHHRQNSHQLKNRQHHHPHHHSQSNNNHQHPFHNQHRLEEDSGTNSPVSGFTAGVIITERRPHQPQHHHHHHQQQQPAISNINNRRKQRMNQVRCDDSLDEVASRNSQHHPPSCSNKSARGKESFINLADRTSSSNSNSQSKPSAHLPGKPHPSDRNSHFVKLGGKSSFSNPSTSSKSSSSSSFLSSSSSSSLSSSSSSSLPQGRQSGQSNTNRKTEGDSSQMSNFEYFSIHQGRITSVHSLSTNSRQTTRNECQNSSGVNVSSPHSSIPKLSHPAPSKTQNRNGSSVIKQTHHQHSQQLQHQENTNLNKQRRQQEQQSQRQHPSFNTNSNSHCKTNAPNPHRTPNQQQQQQPHHPSLNNLNNSSRQQQKSGDRPVTNANPEQKSKRDFHRPGPRSFQMSQLGIRPPARASSLFTKEQAGNAQDDDVMEVICIDD